MRDLPEWTDLPSGERLHKTTIQSRMSLGWSYERASTTPVRPIKRKTNIAADARSEEVNPFYVQMRMRELGETFEEATEYVRRHGTAGVTPTTLEKRRARKSRQPSVCAD